MYEYVFLLLFWKCILNLNILCFAVLFISIFFSLAVTTNHYLGLQFWARQIFNLKEYIFNYSCLQEYTWRIHYYLMRSQTCGRREIVTLHVHWFYCLGQFAVTVATIWRPSARLWHQRVTCKRIVKIYTAILTLLQSWLVLAGSRVENRLSWRQSTARWSNRMCCFVTSAVIVSWLVLKYRDRKSFVCKGGKVRVSNLNGFCSEYYFNGYF